MLLGDMQRYPVELASASSSGGRAVIRKLSETQENVGNA